MRSPWRVLVLTVVLLALAAPSAQSTYVQTVAGGGQVGFTYGSVFSLDVGLGAPSAVAIAHGAGSDGLDYYVADTNGCRIYRVNATNTPGGSAAQMQLVMGLE